MKNIFLIIITFFSFSLFSQSVEEEWTHYYDGYSAKGNETLAIDSSGEYLYFTSHDYDVVSLYKVNETGEVIWRQDQQFPGFYFANSCEIKTDIFDFIYVSGYCDAATTMEVEYFVLKYDENGNLLWNAVCDYVDFMMFSKVWLFVDYSQNVYITAQFPVGGTSDVITIKYNADGQEEWHQIFAGDCGGNDFPGDIYVDSSQNVLITGQTQINSTEYDIFLLKYAADGQMIWDQTYEANTSAYQYNPRICLDANEDIYLIGMQKFGENHNFAILKYDQSGNLLWMRSYDGNYYNSTDCARDLLVDDEGNLVVFGEVENYGTLIIPLDFALMKYSSDGDLIWHQEYSGPGHKDYPKAMTLDLNNEIYVTGMMEYWFNTLKYDEYGSQLWQIFWEEPEDLRYEAYVTDIRVNDDGDVYVLGYNNAYDVTLVKYNQPDFTPVSQNSIPEIKAELSNFPNPFNPTTTISFSVTQTCPFATIEIYNLKGQKVKQFSHAELFEAYGTVNIYSVNWNGTDNNFKAVSTGIYYAILKQNGKMLATRKMILMK